MRNFPFPDKIESREELTRDLLYKKIDPAQYQEISDRAWEIGVGAMQEMLKKYPDKDIMEICYAEGLEIVHENKDQVTGAIRFFSEYYEKHRRIVLYDKSLRLWAKKNGMSFQDAEKLLLSHELFHHLECTRIGMVSEQHKVPWLRLGKLKIGTCGIRALSEIGAHGFSRTYYDQKGLIRDQDAEGEEGQQGIPKLQNYAMDEMDLRASQGAGGLADIPGIKHLLPKK